MSCSSYVEPLGEKRRSRAQLPWSPNKQLTTSMAIKASRLAVAIAETLIEQRIAALKRLSTQLWPFPKPTEPPQPNRTASKCRRPYSPSANKPRVIGRVNSAI